MRVQRRIYWTLPVLAAIGGVLTFVIIWADPERSHTAAGWLGADIYYPRWIVYIGDRVMMAATIFADLAIGVACMLIALSFWRNRGGRVHFNPESIVLFAFLFLSVGLTHLIITLTFASGIYLLDILVRSSAAAMCLVTSGFVAKSLLWPRKDE